jgi:flagellar basal-body rod modification protein FlgD
MNEISSIGSYSNPTESSQIGKKSSVEDTKMQFLQLLLAQIKHQDPMSPTDTDQFTAQMMQMGQLEQLFNLNETMGNLVSAQQGSMIAGYSQMVGKTALATGNVFELGTAGGQMQFSVESIPHTSQVRVFDKFNNLVRTFDTTIMNSGGQLVSFDGKDSKGNQLNPGYYTFSVEAKDHDANTIPVTTFSTGRISSVRLQNGQPIFQLGENDLAIQEIQKVF